MNLKQIKQGFRKIILNLNTLSILLLVIGVSISYIIPTKIHGVNVQSRKEMYVEFSNNAVRSLDKILNESSVPSLLSQVMGTFNVSLEQFSEFAETESNIHDIGSTFYVLKIPNSGIQEFEVTASEIHGFPVKIINETFQELSNYTEEYAWPVLYDYFPGGSSSVNFIGFNIYWGQLRENIDEMLRTKRLVYSDPVTFFSDDTTGLLQIRPVFKKNEVSSCIVRGIRPSSLLFEVDTELLKNKFGSDLCIYITRNNSIDMLFCTSLEITENCSEIRLSSSSNALLCISDMVDKKRDLSNILSICGGIIVSILIAILVKTLGIVSDTDKRSKIKSRLIAHVSHELRTPMNAIMGMSELITIEKDKLPEKVSSYVDSIYSAAKVLLSIIDDVLDMNDIESNNMKLNMSHVNLRELIQTTVQTSWYSVKTHTDVILTLNILDSVPTSVVKADPSKITQILSNLISNSLKFTKEGTVDVISSTRVLDETKLKLEISVSDTGIGMSNKQMKVIFEPFMNVGGKGPGLGLSICKNLTELMGGKLTCKSVFGKGTTFYLSCLLDLSEKFTTGNPQEFVFSKDSEVSVARKRYSETRYVVLVVDDMDINRMVLSKMLETIGISTESCNNGAESVELCKKHKFSAILMDVFMPIMDGIDATRNIRNFSPINKETPILFVSATVESSYIQKCHEAGGNSFIRKPVTMSVLQRELEKNITT